MKHYHRHLFVQESPIEGKGLYCAASVLEDEIIMKIEGEIISGDECERRENEEDNVYIFWNGDEYVDVKHTDDIKYINHNCDPNCYVDADANGNLLLVAARDINPGEELTIDYGYDEIYDICSCDVCSAEESSDAEETGESDSLPGATAVKSSENDDAEKC